MNKVSFYLNNQHLLVFILESNFKLISGYLLIKTLQNVDIEFKTNLTNNQNLLIT